MSLILEALKKSETRRRLGESPTLATPFGPTKRRRSLLPWLLLVFAVAIAGVAAWQWLHLRRTSVPGVTVTPAATPALSGNTPKSDRDFASASHPESHPAGSASTAAPKTTASTPLTSAQASITASPNTAPPITAPLKTSVSAGSPAAASTPPAASTAMVTRPALAQTAAAKPTSPPAAMVAAPLPAAAAPAPAAAAVAAAASTPPAPAHVTEPEQPAVQSINDLPYSLRKDLPDMPVSMQVYSADPARRFIIVDGERKKEGDTIRDVAVREIRANGVVLEFRGQRFLLPRPGS